jgi:hypothetical protein
MSKDIVIPDIPKSIATKLELNAKIDKVAAPLKVKRIKKDERHMNLGVDALRTSKILSKVVLKSF